MIRFILSVLAIGGMSFVSLATAETLCGTSSASQTVSGVIGGSGATVALSEENALGNMFPEDQHCPSEGCADHTQTGCEQSTGWVGGNRPNVTTVWNPSEQKYQSTTAPDPAGHKGWITCAQCLDDPE